MEGQYPLQDFSQLFTSPISIAPKGGEQIWVPCIPHYPTGTFIPLYSLSTFPFQMMSIKDFSKLKTPAPINRGGAKTKHWSELEENRLGELVATLGTKQWVSVSGILNDEFHAGESIRKGKNCRERWHNHLDPNLNSNCYVEGEWSYGEDLILLKEQKAKGNKWSRISDDLLGRTENSVKNRYNSLIRKARTTYNMQLFPEATVSEILIQEFEAKFEESQ